MRILSRRRNIIIILVAILVIGIGLWVWSDLRKARLTIITDPQATISASLEDPTSLEEVGTGEATIKTGSTSNIYVQVQLGDSVSRGVYTLESSERRQVEITLESTIERSRVAPGPLANIFLTDSYGYGTDPLSQIPVSLPNVDNPSNTPPDYSDIDRISDIAWVNERNFVYDEFGRGVNFFVDGSVFDLDNGAEAEFELQPFLQDFASNDPSKSILILDGTLLFQSDGVQTKRMKIIKDDLNTTRQTQMYSLTDRAVLATPLYESEPSVAEESVTPLSIDADLAGEGVESQTLSGYRILILDYSGNELDEFIVDTELPIRDVASFGEGGYILVQQSGVLVFDGGIQDSQRLPLFNSGINDVVAYGKDLLVLDEAGLWRYRTDSGVLHLLSGYGQDETYSPDSFAIRNNTAIYSVSVIPEVLTFEQGEEIDYLALDAQQNSDRGYIYSVQLD